MQTKLHQRLDREADELELWKSPRADVRDRLIAHYLPYALMLASKRAAKQQLVDPDEYEQQAMIGLWHAIDNYDPSKGAAFTTHARTRIVGQLIEGERANDWVKPKVRAAYHSGELDLPAMHGMGDGFDCLDDEPETTVADRLAAILESADVVVRRFAELIVACNHDVCELAGRLNVSAEVAGSVIQRWTIQQLQGTPCSIS